MSAAFELNDPQQGRAVLAAARKRFRTAPGEIGRDRRLHYDTFDWRLWRAGYRLVATREGKAWLVECSGPEARHRRRQRLSGEPGLVRDLPAGPLRAELGPIVDVRRLLPLMEVQRRRRELRLLDKRDKTVARLRLETAKVRPPGHKDAIRLPDHLVAVPVRGFDAAFEELLTFLEAQQLRRDDEPVLARAHAACDLKPGEYRPKVQVPLEPELPAHLAMRRILRHVLGVMENNEPGLRRDLDTEFLHDFRVAVRRTRAALSQVRGIFPPGEKMRRFRDEFRWLGGLTNLLRDLDVYLLKLDDYRAGLPAEVVAELAPLERLLLRRQRAEHRRVIKALDSDRYRRLLSEWAAFLGDEEIPGTPDTGRLPVAVVARERILEAHRRVIDKGRAIDPETPDKRLHRLRIHCKKLRYLMEFFRNLYEPDEISAVIGSLKSLQANLGDFNDLSVQQGAMRGFAEELAAEGQPAATLLALGRLITGLARRQGEERRRFHDRFARFDRPKVRKRLRRMLDGAVP